MAQFHPLACFAAAALALGACATARLAPVARPAGVPAAHSMPSDANVFDVADLDARPQARFTARPQYPAMLRRRGIGGHATVDVIVGPDGNVYDAYVADATAPEFGQAALAAVNHWKFSPGMKNGNAVWTHFEVPIVFKVDQGD